MSADAKNVNGEKGARGADARAAKGAKRLLRERFSEKRRALSSQDRAAIDQMIECNICALPEFQRAETVLAYMAFRDEISTRGIVEKAWEEGKAVAFPRCVPSTRRLLFYQVNSFDELETGSFGILEPRSEGKGPLASFGGRTLCIVPALTFDSKGHRLGYGGGYYDRFLAGFQGTTVGLCPESLLSDEPLGLEEHDVPVDIVVTESRVIRLG